MYAWEQIQLTLEYIENNVEEQINIEHLASIASLSPFYYQRLFSRLVKIPVAEYIKQRRLSLSLEKLKQTDDKILNIALDLGFSSHEHFSKSFRVAFGMSPEEYKKSEVLLNHITKPELSLNYTAFCEGVPIIADNIILEISKKTLDSPLYYLGISTNAPISFIENQGIKSGPDPLENVWNYLHSQKINFIGLEDNEELGVTLPSTKEGYFKYFVGAKVKSPYDCALNEMWVLPKGNYLVCYVEAPNFKTLVTDVLYKAINYVYNTWIPSHRLKTDIFCAERYFSCNDGISYVELWLKILD